MGTLRAITIDKPESNQVAALTSVSDEFLMPGNVTLRVTTTTPLEEVFTCADDLLDGKVRGRVVVTIGQD